MPNEISRDDPARIDRAEKRLRETRDALFEAENRACDRLKNRHMESDLTPDNFRHIREILRGPYEDYQKAAASAIRAGVLGRTSDSTIQTWLEEWVNTRKILGDKDTLRNASHGEQQGVEQGVKPPFTRAECWVRHHGTRLAEQGMGPSAINHRLLQMLKSGRETPNIEFWGMKKEEKQILTERLSKSRQAFHQDFYKKLIKPAQSESD